MVYHKNWGIALASFGIGAKLRQERLARGLSLDDISRDTRIAPRFLEAIETDDHSSLPGIVFARNFVRQYALVLGMDAEPLVAVLPKYDQSQAPLPNPPAHGRRNSSYRRERQLHALTISAVWLVILGGPGIGIYIHFNHGLHIPTAEAHSSIANTSAAPAETKAAVPLHAPAVQAGKQEHAQSASNTTAAVAAGTDPAAPVQVSLTAHARAWIRLSVDGKTTFDGTLNPDETKEVSAMEQVNLITGNAGALTILLNGKTLDKLGRFGQKREVRLTAEGPQLLTKDPPREPDQL